jgi:hypothetical protein
VTLDVPVALQLIDQKAGGLLRDLRGTGQVTEPAAALIDARREPELGDCGREPGPAQLFVQPLLVAAGGDEGQQSQR